MSLIIVEKPESRATMKLTISKILVEKFEQEVAIFNQNSKRQKLNFDRFAQKIIKELQQINKRND